VTVVVWLQGWRRLSRPGQKSTSRRCGGGGGVIIIITTIIITTIIMMIIINIIIITKIMIIILIITICPLCPSSCRDLIPFPPPSPRLFTDKAEKSPAFLEDLKRELAELQSRQ